MSEAKTQRERNQSILDTYDGSDIYHPQVILRKVNQVDGNVLDDELFGVKLSCCRDYDFSYVWDQLPENFKWAAYGIVDFITQYNELLKHPTERIHLEALAQNGRIFIEDRCSSTRGNSKSGGYEGMSTFIYGKPAIVLVARYCNRETLLHEAIHNSDLRVYRYKGSFSAQKIYQAAIMMLDAQKIQSSRGYESVKCLRKINRIYQDGEIYAEGLAWITSMPMEKLAKEKNHIGKNLKILHSLYTEASVSLKNQLAVIEYFQFWQPSAHIAKLLEVYNKNGQKIGKERNKILKQQKHFWDELMKFRKEINKLKVRGIQCNSLSLNAGALTYCQNNGVNSLLPAYLAQDTFRKSYQSVNDDEKDEIANHCLHTEMLKTLFADIKPADFSHPALFAEKFLTCREYLFKMRSDFLHQNNVASLFDTLNADKKLSGIAARYMLYNNMKALIEIAYMQTHSHCSDKECTLAYLYDIRPETAATRDMLVQLKLKEADSVEQKRSLTERAINRAQEELSHRTLRGDRFLADAVWATEHLLKEYNLPSGIHGILQLDDLQNFSVSANVVRDLQWIEAKNGDDGLPAEMYRHFEPGIIADYCSRPTDAFNPKSEDYVPNNYLNSDSKKVAHTRALYEFLALRHAYQAKTHCKKFPPNLRLNAFTPNSDYYRQIRSLSAPQKAPTSETNGNTGK